MCPVFLRTYNFCKQTAAVMSAKTQTAAGGTGESGCWCCGRSTSYDALVHLGNHPEVGICINCVHFLGRRARDYQATVMRQRLRASLTYRDAEDAISVTAAALALSVSLPGCGLDSVI